MRNKEYVSYLSRCSAVLLCPSSYLHNNTKPLVIAFPPNPVTVSCAQLCLSSVDVKGNFFHILAAKELQNDKILS